MGEIADKILAGCRKGNRRSQEELYRTLAPAMYGLCLKYAGNSDEAKDIMQDGFIKVFQKIDQFQGKGSLEGWVRKIMVNTALEMFRGQVEMYPVDEKLHALEDTYHSGALEELSAEEILKLVQQLPPQYRMVFNLYAIEGYNHKDIALLLDISEGTSKSNLSRARAILQKKILVMNKVH